MNEETLLQREEKQELFYRLVDLNERGKIHWECVEYIPISFMDKDMLEGKPAYLTQMFTLTLQVQNTFYKMEIDEYLTVPDGKGDIHFKLTRPTKDNYLELEIHKNLGNRMKPGVPAHGASRFTTQLPLLQDRTGLDMPAQPGAKSAVQDSHTAVSFYERRASRGSVVKPPWNTGPNAAREDMPRKGLNKAERHTRKWRQDGASFLLPHGECGVRGDAPQESLGLPSGPPFSKGEEDLPHDDGTCC